MTDDPERLDSQRYFLLSISLFWLAVPLLIIHAAATQGHSTVFPNFVYVAFVIAVGALQAVIAGRLFGMHEFRKFVFDIPIWFLVAALLALPLGTAGLFTNWIHSIERDQAPYLDERLSGFIAFYFYISMLPIFFVTEASLHIAVIIRNSMSEPTKD